MFDFRGSGGGNDDYVYRWAKKAGRGKWPAPYIELDASVQLVPAATGTIWCSISSSTIASTRQVRAASVTKPRARHASGGADAPIHRIGSAFEESNGKDLYKGRIFALVDGNCRLLEERAEHAARCPRRDDSW